MPCTSQELEASKVEENGMFVRIILLPAFLEAICSSEDDSDELDRKQQSKSSKACLAHGQKRKGSKMLIKGYCQVVSYPEKTDQIGARVGG